MSNPLSSSCVPPEQLGPLLTELAGLLPEAHATVPQWQQQLQRSSQRLREAYLRVAVIGTVKSGKSTLVNALVGQDLVRRGAGILTSAVTRLRAGEEFQAEIQLRPLPELTEEALRAAARLARTLEWAWEAPDSLEALMARLPEWMAHVPPNVMALEEDRRLLQSLQQGWAEMQPWLRDFPQPLIWSGAAAKQHQDWVSRDATAAYLAGVLLRVPELPFGLELADCQGSDSPNPLHLLRVQDYLAGATAVLYVLSSRTGLREADLRLLAVLRELGLLEQTVFVLNLDLGEHDSVSDAERVRQSVQHELGGLPNPVLSVSALYRLLQQLPQGPTEALRLQLWEQNPELIELHEQGWAELNQTLTGWQNRRQEELKRTEQQHLRTLTQRVVHWVEQARKALETHSAQMPLGHLTESGLEEVLRTLEAMLDQKLAAQRDPLKERVRCLLHEGRQSLLQQLQRFQEQHQLPASWGKAIRLREMALELPGALGLEAYQDLQQRQLRFLAEEVNPGLLAQLRQLASEFEEGLRQMRQAFGTLLAAQAPFAEVEWERALPVPQFPDLPPPAFSSTLEWTHTARFKSLLSLGREAFKSPEARMQALRERLEQQLKEDAAEALQFDLFNYQENLLHRYLLAGLTQMGQEFRESALLLGQSLLAEQRSLEALHQRDQASQDDLSLRLTKLLERLQGSGG